MNNKNWVRALLLAIAVFGGAQVVRAADGAGWYLGVGGGRADVKKPSSWTQVEAGTLQLRGVTSTTLVESQNTAWKIFGGYQFNEYWAVEAAYHDMGSSKGVTTITAPTASVAPGKWDASAGSISGVGIYPLISGLAVFGKAGLALSQLKVDVPGALYSPSATRVQPLLGVGLRFDFNKTFGMRGEFERFNNVGDGSSTGQSPIYVWSLGAQVRF
jgi:OOP family OmpA-OmpF porin